jgi:O-antigen/teichoic acid export membrane protein
MFRKALLILSGNAFGSLMLLLRNLAVARLVSVEDYGIAATFAISMAIVEMASGLGLQQLIVQDKDGENPDLQAGLQGFNVIRSVLSAIVLFLLAQPIAHFLDIPDVAWAYQVLALVPLLRGFEHFDIHRLNRVMRFGPLILTKTVPAALSVASIWPLYLIYGDYRVMLYSVILHWVLTLITGHLVAERRYQLNVQATFMKKGLRFGWPLLLNNIVLFLVFQGDKLLVGRELGMSELAIFAMGVTFTLTPTLISAASEQQFFLPQLSKLQAGSDRTQFTALARAAMQASLLSGMAMVLAITLLAQPLVTLLLGGKYQPLIALLPWLAIWQALRAFKVGNTVVALSLAQTSNAMIANGVRALSLPLAWYVLTQGGSLMQIIWIAMAGETLAYVLSLVMVTRRARLNLRPLILPGILALTSFGVIALFATGAEARPLIASGASGLLMLSSFASMRDFRQYLRTRAHLPQPAKEQ